MAEPTLGVRRAREQSGQSAVQPGSIQPVTPEEIIRLILSEMHAEMAPSFYSILVRSVYHVHLAPEEMERLRLVLPHTREEAIRALNEELANLNRPGKFPSFLSGKRKRYQTLGEWVVEFHENLDDDARENPLIVHSDFGIPQPTEDRLGALTERVLRRNAGGSLESISRPAQMETHRTHTPVHAVLEYEDETGPHLYEMSKNQIKIGRGGEHVWVDVCLQAPRDVSREHLQIRRSPSGARYFLKDLSKLGTTVNGKPVPPSLETDASGNVIDKEVEVPLPSKAKIELAGVLTIHFRAVRPK
ncbi:MAG: FHA domain-containing protein [Bryobacteraceae bacterium]|nr:FHA domain-containing protein [Bryobacteraceae bacterium]